MTDLLHTHTQCCLKFVETFHWYATLWPSNGRVCIVLRKIHLWWKIRRKYENPALMLDPHFPGLNFKSIVRPSSVIIQLFHYETHYFIIFTAEHTIAYIGNEKIGYVPYSSHKVACYTTQHTNLLRSNLPWHVVYISANILTFTISLVVT